MSSWFVYIAVDNNELITGICNDLIQEEILLKEELTETALIKWYEQIDLKVKALKKLEELNNLSDEEKFFIVSAFNKIIILKDDDFKENYNKFPLVYNLKQTLSLSQFLKANPEIWKLDESYIEDVTEYLSIKKTQIEFSKLWNIAIDYSLNVGLVTKDKFFPIIKY